MHSSKIFVRICGKGFNVVSDEDAEYMKKVVSEVDSRMTELMGSDSRMTYDSAAVLTALNLYSELENVRTIMQTSKDNNDTIDALEKKLEAAESSIAELKAQLAKEREHFSNEKEKMRLEWILKEKEFLDMIDEG